MFTVRPQTNNQQTSRPRVQCASKPADHQTIKQNVDRTYNFAGLLVCWIPDDEPSIMNHDDPIKQACNPDIGTFFPLGRVATSTPKNFACGEQKKRSLVSPKNFLLRGKIAIPPQPVLVGGWKVLGGYIPPIPPPPHAHVWRAVKGMYDCLAISLRTGQKYGPFCYQRRVFTHQNKVHSVPPVLLLHAQLCLKETKFFVVITFKKLNCVIRAPAPPINRKWMMKRSTVRRQYRS
jgi:hypothetical protein